MRQVPVQAAQHLSMNLFSKSETALDAIWLKRVDPTGLIELHDHMVRLCMVCNELAERYSPPWAPVYENLLLAASLTDISADTDLQNTTFMCRPAAEYEAVHSQLTEKHVAGMIVTSFVWTAYECAVEAVAGKSASRRPKGALGRNLLFNQFGDHPFPYLRDCVLRAIGVTLVPPPFSSEIAKTILAEGAWAAIGAEQLREFRNAMIHGKLRKPEPRNWGDEPVSEYANDPSIMQFEPNVRLILLLIQILALCDTDPDDQLSGWRLETDPAHLLLSQLHCVIDEVDAEAAQPPLPIELGPLRTPDEAY